MWRMRTMIFLVLGVVPFLVSAATSTNFQLRQEEEGVSTFGASSNNYQFNAAFGEGVQGVTESPNYFLRQGTSWIGGSATGTAFLSILYSAPQGRVGSDNDDSIFYLTVRSATNTDDQIIATQVDLATTSVAGSYAGVIAIPGVFLPGTYDIGMKTDQNLTKILQDVPLTASPVTLNFTATSTDYASTTRGTEVLLTGDVSDLGISPDTLGDDVVNVVDVNLVVASLDATTTPDTKLREDLNQDEVVNVVDITLQVGNLDKNGEN